MKNQTGRFCLLFLLCFLPSLFIFQLKAAGQGAPSEDIATQQFAQKRIESLHQAANTLRRLAAEPLPANLADDEKKEAMKYTQWLINSSRKLNELAQRWQDDLSRRNKFNIFDLPEKQPEEVNTSFQRQCKTLREDLLRELRHYTLISQVMKDNYDHARSTISSLR
jgi:GTPase SAR1 family protein